MKRASITFPDDLESQIAAYLRAQATPPSLSKLVQVALREYLERQAWLEREVRPAKGPLNLPVSDAEVEPDVSVRHD
jgi:metal-responsive CopG/Arc/MetJ family transcriptional regulator